MLVDVVIVILVVVDVMLVVDVTAMLLVVVEVMLVEVVVVLTEPTDDSQRGPIWVGGQSHTRLLPLIRQVPPFSQNVAVHCTTKDRKE